MLFNVLSRMDVRFGILLRTLITISHVKGQETYKTMYELPWDDAVHHCTLATPEITYTYDGPVVSPSSLESLGLRNGESAWVVYVQSYKVFQYTGCVKNNIITQNITMKNVISDPGQCFSACNTTTFGMRYSGSEYSKCYCFETDIQLNGSEGVQPYCNKFCSNPRNTACGGVDNELYYVSLYEYVPDYRVSYQSGKHFCNTITLTKSDEQNHSFEWRDCNESFKPLCISNDTNKIIEQFIYNEDWFNAANKCFERKTYPPSYTWLINFKKYDETETFWTGMVRTPVIFKQKDFPDSNARVGYVEATSNDEATVYRLHFTAIKNTKKASYCNNEEDIADISTSSIVTPSTGIDDKTTTAATPAKDDNDESDIEKILPYIGAAIGFFVFVGAIVGIVCVCKRRLKKTSQSNQHNVDKTQPAEYEMAYATDDKLNDTRNHDDGLNYVDVNAADNTYAEASQTIFETQRDDTYNHTNGSFKLETGQSDNFDTYNHLGGVNKKSSSEANTYDTTNAKTAVTRDDEQHPLYNTKTSKAENEYKTSETTFSNNKNKQHATENVYNTLENETDDTYSHTNANMNKKDEGVEYDVCSNNQRQ